MPTTVPYLRLTDGTTTLNLLDGTNYALERGTWAPQVPERRRTTMGGRPYTSVVEEIPLIVRGATAATALANLAALSALLDQADRWSEDEMGSPVRVLYQPHGSTLAAPLESLILGRAPGDSISLPLTMNDVGMLFEISGVWLRFVRDGVWYGVAETTVAPMVPGPVDHPEVLVGTFGSSAAHLSPVTVSLAPLPEPTTIGDYDAGYLLLANSATRLNVIDASTMTATDFTSDADAARQPEGAGVLVYTPAGTTQATSGAGTLGLEAGRRVGVIAALRNTSGTTYEVEVEISGPTGRNAATTRPYHVDGSTTDPRIVLLGIALSDDPDYSTVKLLVTASAASGTLVVDYLALILLDDPTSRIIAIGPIEVDGQIVNTETSTLTVDPRELSSQSPRIRQTDDSAPTVNYAVPEYWRGDAFLLSSGNTIAAVWCGRNDTYWRAWDTVAVDTPQATLGFSRRPAYLAPI